MTQVQQNFGSLEIGETFAFSATGVAAVKTTGTTATLVNDGITVSIDTAEIVSVANRSYYGSIDHEQDLIEWEADMERNNRWYEGDARRCAIHPDIKTSSDDGMFDGDCWKCEQAMCEEGSDYTPASVEREHEAWTKRK